VLLFAVPLTIASSRGAPTARVEPVDRVIASSADGAYRLSVGRSLAEGAAHAGEPMVTLSSHERRLWSRTLDLRLGEAAISRSGDVAVSGRALPAVGRGAERSGPADLVLLLLDRAGDELVRVRMEWEEGPTTHGPDEPFVASVLVDELAEQAVFHVVERPFAERDRSGADPPDGGSLWRLSWSEREVVSTVPVAPGADRSLLAWVVCELVVVEGTSLVAFYALEYDARAALAARTP